MFSVIYGGYARYNSFKKDFLKIFNKKYQVKIKDSDDALTFRNFCRPLQIWKFWLLSWNENMKSTCFTFFPLFSGFSLFCLLYFSIHFSFFQIANSFFPPLNLHLDVTIDPSNIEDCLWLKSNGPSKVIIKFARRKDPNLIWKNKNKLKGMNLCSIGINNSVFINDSLCSHYKMLWRKWKKLWSSKYIHAFWVSNGTLRLKLTESGRVHIITHSQDLDELFPENELLRDDQ